MIMATYATPLFVLLIISMQMDRLYNWKSVADAPIRDSFKRQKEHVMTEFEQRSSQVFLQLNELVRTVVLCAYCSAECVLCECVP